MKSVYGLLVIPIDHRSLPTRGAWIEIGVSDTSAVNLISRSPHGERGLKFIYNLNPNTTVASLPTRGAWIEIEYGTQAVRENIVAPHTGSVD